MRLIDRSGWKKRTPQSITRTHRCAILTTVLSKCESYLCSEENRFLSTLIIYPTFQAAKLIQIVPNEYDWLLQIDSENFCVDLKLLGKSISPKFVILSHLQNAEFVDSNPLFLTIGKYILTAYQTL